MGSPSTKRSAPSQSEQQDAESSHKQQKLENSCIRICSPPISDAGLCGRCATIDFDSLLENIDQIPPDGLEVVKLGYLQIASADFVEQCDLCKLFSHNKTTIGEGDHSFGFQLRAFRGLPRIRSKQSTCAPTVAVSSPGVDTIILAVTSLNPRIKYTTNRHNQTLVYGGLIACTRTLRGHEKCIRQPTPMVVFESLRGSLEHCKRHHKGCRNQQPQSQVTVKVIDCLKNSVVDLPHGAEYLCLSYCWGPHRTITIKTLEDLRSGIAPATILNAVEATLRLGQRYLWVDRYCIPQDDCPERQQALTQMDTIYEKGLLTLVAAHGNDDEGGLPGVSEARPSPLVVTTQHSTLWALPRDMSPMVQESRWNSRAWTYQEARFSSRCVFFFENQTYFVCKSASCTEVVPLHDTSDGPCSFTNTVNLAQLKPSLFAKPLWSEPPVFEDLFAFCARKLTRQSDRLDAFLGCLNRSGYWSYCGILLIPQRDTGKGTTPLVKDQNISFALGLSWCRKIWNNFDRNPYVPIDGKRTLPTWSWASWDTRPHYNFQLRRHRGIAYSTQDRHRTSCVFWMVDEEGHETSFDEAIAQLPRPGPISFARKILHVEAEVFDAKAKGKPTASSIDDLAKYFVPCYPSSRLSGYLDIPEDKHPQVLSLVFLVQIADNHGLYKDWEYHCLAVEWTAPAVARRVGYCQMTPKKEMGKLPHGKRRKFALI